MGAAVVTDLLLELQPVVEQNLDRHLSVAKEWLPHEYVPWSQGRDFVAEPWEPGDSRLTPEAVAALEINLLTEDNLPSYHHEIAVRFGRDGAWGTWVHRWTAEEGRHAMCLRDYLLVTRGLDPDALERQRMAVMRTGYDSGGKSVPEALAYVSLQELATRVSHRNTGRLIRDPVADRLLARVAADENLHMIFYRRLVSAALEIAPATLVTAIAREIQDFAMPGAGIPGFARKAAQIARAGIYNLRIHCDEIVLPLVRHWRLFERDGVDGPALDGLAAFLEQLDAAARRQEDKINTLDRKRPRTKTG
jgi:acyl-[acyl-carrier-protein] desaturase